MLFVRFFLNDNMVVLLIKMNNIFLRVVVQGPGPGPRYGHVMALVGQRYLMAIGGNDGMPLSHLIVYFSPKLLYPVFISVKPCVDMRMVY